MSHCGLICISLMVSQVEHLLMDLLAICISSFEKCPLKTFSHFSSDCLLFYQVLSVSHILDVNPLSDMRLADILSHFILLFPLLCRIFLLWCSPTCSFLLLLIVLLVSYKKKKSRPRSMSRSFCPGSFMISSLILRSLILG